METHDHYTCRVTWSDEDHEHVGLCAEFSGLTRAFSGKFME